MPAVSVLLPCYNAAGTIEEAMDSLAHQTLTDFEIIVVDDGSTDESAQILKAWAEKDHRLRLLACPHGGIVTALNAGLEACQAAYVARMDADDRAHPERLERQVAFLDAHPQVDVVSCRVAAFPVEQVGQGFAIYIDWLNALLSDEQIRREIFVESPLPHPSVTFRKERILQIGGYQDHGWAEDYDLWLRLYLAGGCFHKLPEVLLEWRERPDRLSRIDGCYSVENFLRAKAYYLGRGPLGGREAVFVWGAGMIGRRLAKQLLRQGVPLVAFVDIDPRKIGHTRRGLPVISPGELPTWLERFASPAVLAAVGARGARQLIRRRLNALGLKEGEQWWAVA